MIIAEVLIGIGLVCVMVGVAKIAFWAGKKVEKREMEKSK
jgi:flagellar basal body-associated protein FliL